MKRRFKEKHQDSPSDEEGGNTGDEKGHEPDDGQTHRGLPEEGGGSEQPASAPDSPGDVDPPGAWDRSRGASWDAFWNSASPQFNMSLSDDPTEGLSLSQNLEGQISGDEKGGQTHRGLPEEGRGSAQPALALDSPLLSSDLFQINSGFPALPVNPQSSLRPSTYIDRPQSPWFHQTLEGSIRRSHSPEGQRPGSPPWSWEVSEPTQASPGPPHFSYISYHMLSSRDRYEPMCYTPEMPANIDSRLDTESSQPPAVWEPYAHATKHTSSPTTSAQNQALPPSQSLADEEENSSFEEFSPDVTADGDDETFRFRCSRPGVYLCTVTRLVFAMKAGGVVVYGTVPWIRTLLGQHHQKPAGPLFAISCVEQSVTQLHLPHCEVSSSGGGRFLSVAHVTDEAVEIISPHRVTDTHVVINVSGFSAYGNVKAEDSPPDPVRAQVLLFYRPPADPHPESFLSVLLLPANVVARDVHRSRRRLIGDEVYVPASSHCRLQPNRRYRLSTCPQDSVKVQPKKAEFYEQFCYNFHDSFTVILKTAFRSIKLGLRPRRRFKAVWKQRVYLPPACEQRVLNLPLSQKLVHMRSRFVDAVSGPVLKDLLDKLLEKGLITDSEQEEAETLQSRGDRARFLVDTVKRKGDAASSALIQGSCHCIGTCLFVEPTCC